MCYLFAGHDEKRRDTERRGSFRQYFAFSFWNCWDVLSQFSAIEQTRNNRFECLGATDLLVNACHANPGNARPIAAVLPSNSGSANNASHR